MDNYKAENQEQEIDLVSLFFAVAHRYKQMAAAAVICAVLFGGLSVVKGMLNQRAIDAAIADVKAGRTGPVPRELQNVHADGTGFERDQGYLCPHNFPNHWVRQQYLPDVIKDRVYYTYGDNKTEQAAKRYWDEIKGPQP